MPGSKEEYEYWGRLASKFDEGSIHVVGSTVYQNVKGWLVNQFNDMDAVLELGCGTGYFSQMITDKVKHLTSTDLSHEMLEQAKEKLGQYNNVEVQKEDCYGTSFENNMFDAVLLVNLLHIVKVVIVDATGHGMPFFSKMGLGIRYVRTWGKPTPYSRSLNPTELSETVKESGFVIEDVKIVGKKTKAVCLNAKKVK
jgi:SAM-dependent methyltransferase